MPLALSFQQRYRHMHGDGRLTGATLFISHNDDATTRYWTWLFQSIVFPKVQ